MSLSKFVQEEFLKSGLNKAQFARKMSGMHPTELARILDGPSDRLPSSKVLEKLARGMQMSVADLVAISGQTQYRSRNESGLLEAFYPELEARSRALADGGNPQQVLTPEHISNELCRMMEEIFRPDPAYQSDPAQCAEILQTYPKSSKIFYLEEQEAEQTTIRIIGSWSVVFLDEQAGERLAKGEAVPAQDLTLKNLSSMVMPGRYTAFLQHMSLKNQYNSYEYAPALVGSFLRQMEEYARYGIYIRSIYVNVYDRDCGFYKGLGFRPVQRQEPAAGPGESIPHLYCLEHFPEDFVFPAGQELLQSIRQLYDGNR